MISWAEWMDTCGVDLFGCDENCSPGGRGPFGSARKLQKGGDDRQQDLHRLDYASLHDEFLESLLSEQSRLSGESSHSSSEDDIVEPSSPLSAHGGRQQDAQQSQSPPRSRHGDAENPQTPPHRKRRRQIQLQSRSSSLSSAASSVLARSSKASAAGTAAAGGGGGSRTGSRTGSGRANSLKDSQGSNGINKSVEISFEEIARLKLPDPDTYVHPLCRMQKDKGRGEEVGASICAKGRDACLEKLRVKMRLLTDIVLDASKGPATMKRKRAKVSQLYDNFTETRSVIELKMGFLSMTYGVLLRWDTSVTGKVTLVVLRKMCHESFYPSDKKGRQPPPPLPEQQLLSSCSSFASSTTSFSTVRDVVDSKNAILQRPDGTEVALLEPPYLVPRPAAFEPSFLHASVLHATGMNRRSHWTVKLIYDSVVVNVLLTWNESRRCFLPKPGEDKPMRHAVSSLNLSALTVKLFEHRLRRRNYRRLITTMTIPLANLEAQPHAAAKPLHLLVPCKHDEGAAVAIGLALCSDYGYWLARELETRRRLEGSGLGASPRRAAHLRSADRYCEDDSRDDHENYLWDWICCVC